MKSRKFLLSVLINLFVCTFLYGFNFDELNLSNDDRLLFKAEFESQHAIFLSSLADMSLRQITAFPENLELIENGRSIFVTSRFGAVKIPASGGTPAQIPGLPAFAAGSVPLKGRIQQFAASADGRWVLYIEPVSPAYGSLVLVETSSGAKVTVCEKIELPSKDFPARWSPDSRLFVYSNENKLYYFPIIQDLSAIAHERFRTIGPGGISAVLWGQQGEFYYFCGNTLYKVLNPELFTRTIYGDFLSIGSTAAVFPFEFNSGFDRFWIAPNSDSVLINKNGKGIFFFLLGENQYSGLIYPHVMLPQAAINLNVLWSSSGQITVFSSLPKEIAVWRFEIIGKSIRTLTSRNTPLSANGALSPDGTKAVFWGESGLELWDYANWRPIQRISTEPVYSCAWINNREIASGNGKFIESIDISGQNFMRRTICLSGADAFGFEDARGSRILLKAGGQWFASNDRNNWTVVTDPKLRSVSLTSDRFRVYLEPQSTGPYQNIPMVRNITSTGTVSLVARHSENPSYKPGLQMPVALCFDLYDDDTGLAQTLDALKRLNIKASFFLNGDFIRRNPSSASAIAGAGHELASLFYSPIDLSDSRYRVNAEFIAQGLARNEDELFKATGKELSLIWHPPFYRSSALTNSAALNAGYITVTRDVDVGDWLSRDESLKLGIRQMNASDTIEQIIERKKVGAVIPVRLGLLPGGRDEYLYQRIDVLLDALLRSGCNIVPVSAVIGR